MLNPTQRDPRLYNRPTADEISVIAPGDGSEARQGRDIIIETRTGRLQRVSELHASFFPLRFPLLRPCGEQGWCDQIPLKGNTAVGNAHRRDTQPSSTTAPVQRGKGGSIRVSQAQWYSYYLHTHQNDSISSSVLVHYFKSSW